MGAGAGADIWLPSINRAAGPLYLAIADAIAADILSGSLVGGVRLPPQRTLADALGIDFTTVSRAYAEARRRGLVEGRVGQGTYVRQKRAPAAVVASGLIDMSMNLPPRFHDAALTARMWSGIADLETSGGLDLLLRYQEPGGAAADRAAGVNWLRRRLPAVSVERVLVCPGTQGAMLALAGALAGPGEAICAEALTYPGFRSLAAHLRIRLVEVGIDGEGVDPDAFDAVCRTQKPKALYCAPTLHNPTTATMSLARREAIVAVARRHGVPIIEDDAYGMLPKIAAPPLAALAPELVYHIAGLAKCLAPALRISYLVAPDARATARLAGAIRATTSMASPLTAAIVTRWIEDGVADAVLAAIRKETAARQTIAAALLPAGAAIADPEGYHLWLPLAAPWTRGEFASRLRSAGIGVVVSDAFALAQPPEAVRLGLGAAATREDLTQGLRIVADLLDQSPAMSSMVV
ncbi:MAG: PLP-dependent aminotransferase family protein [Methylocella sp.]